MKTYDIEIEKQLLAALLIDNDSILDIHETITPEHFYLKAHRIIYNAIYKLIESGREATVEMIAHSIDRVDKIGGIGYIAEIAASVASSANVEHQIHILDDYLFKRKLLKYTNDISKILKYTSDRDQIIKYIEDKGEELQSFDYRNKKDSIKSIDALIKENQSKEVYDEMTTSCLKFHLNDIDDMLIIKPTDLVVLAARPSHGKTALSLHLAFANAKRGIPGAYFSLEMGAEYLLKRQAMAEGIKYSGYDGYLLGLKKLAGAKLYIDDRGGQSVRSIKAAVHYLKKSKGIKFVVIDYLQLLNLESGENYSLQLGETVRKIKLMSKQFEVPVILLSQLNREVDKRNDKMPMLSDLRASGNIEEHADTVMFNMIPSNYGITRDSEGKSTQNLLINIIAKQRDGGTGANPIFYDKEKQYFSDWVNR